MSTLETLSRPTPLNLKKLEVVIQPNEGGRYQPTFDFNNTEVIVRPDSRIPPPQEVLGTQKETAIDSQKYMQTVTQRRWEFYSALGILDQLNVVRNYDIPLVRVMWEQMKTEQQKSMWLDYEIEEASAALEERHDLTKVTPRTIRYIIDDDSKLRYAPFPIEPFEEGDKRCVEHYRNINSPDAIREEAGLKGRLKI